VRVCDEAQVLVVMHPPFPTSAALQQVRKVFVGISDLVEDVAVLAALELNGAIVVEDMNAVQRYDSPLGRER